MPGRAPGTPSGFRFQGRPAGFTRFPFKPSAAELASMTRHSVWWHAMTDSTSNPVRYFGRQVRRARTAAGWSLAEFGQRIGYAPGAISRIENGKRPPTELFAQMCDRAFPDRGGWYAEFYAESRTWIATPPWFRNWVEHEQRARTLRIWQLGVLSGLLQTEDYARTILAANPEAPDEDQLSARVAARLKRQAILTSDDAFTAWFLVDEAALRRCVGSPEIMTAQLAHLTGVARLPNVAIQVVPAIAHGGLLVGFALTEHAAYVETAVAGQVFEDPEIIASLLIRFDTLRNEAFRASESLALIERITEEWKATGEKAATPETTAESA